VWRCCSRNEDLTCWCFKGGFPYLLGVPNDWEMWHAEALNQCDAEAVCGCGTGAIVRASADSKSPQFSCFLKACGDGSAPSTQPDFKHKETQDALWLLDR